MNVLDLGEEIIGKLEDWFEVIQNAKQRNSWKILEFKTYGELNEKY